MERSISSMGAAHFVHVRNVNRDLLEKAMELRCVSYLADAKARLLIQTVSTVGESKRDVVNINQQLTREIEARRRAEKELRVITSAVDWAPLHIAICQGGFIQYANHAFRERFLPGDLPPQTRLLDVLTPQDADGLINAALARTPWSGDVLAHDHTGEEITARVLLQPVQNGDNSERLVFFLEDVTRERALQEEQLRSRRLEAIGQLTGGVAHDFNNLMTVISSAAELLQATLQDDNEHTSLVARIVEATERGAALTQQLLAFARRQTLSVEAVDTHTLVDELAVLLRRALGERFTLQIATSGSAAVASCDAGQLEAALLNLVLNARDASEPGGDITIRIRTEHITAPLSTIDGTALQGHFVRLSVEDQGAGVDPEVLSRIWEPFVTTKGEDNSGMGLSMVLGFAAQSGGGVRMDTTPGEGTSVHLYLPLSSAAPASAQPVEHITRPSRVLLVEDDDLVRSSLEQLFRFSGMAVTSVSSQDEALAALDEHARKGDPFALLLTDVVLRRGESGITLGHLVRERAPHLPILFMSGYSHDKIQDEEELPTYRAGFIAKPFRLQQLLDRIHELIDAT